jgi:hypothetical protein
MAKLIFAPVYLPNLFARILPSVWFSFQGDLFMPAHARLYSAFFKKQALSVQPPHHH